MKKFFNSKIIILLILPVFTATSFLLTPVVVFGEEDPDIKHAYQSCQKASEIAAKLGLFMDYNPDFKKVLEDKFKEEVFNSLKEEFKKSGINLNELKNQAVNSIEDFLSKNFKFDTKLKDTFSKTIKNFFKGEYGKSIEEEAKKLKDKAIEKLFKDASKKAEDVIKEKIEGLVKIEVPVEAKGVEKKIEEQKQAQLDEMKRQQTIKTLKEDCDQLLKTTVEDIKKTLLFQLSNQIVDWINTGEKPQFIKNPGRFLKETGRLALDNFISNVAPRLCEPFQLKIQTQLLQLNLLDYHTNSTDNNPFYQEVTCTLDKMVENFENFRKDFKAGGWQAYQELLKPKNNPYGISILVEEEAFIQQIKAQEEAKEAQERGFMGQKKCVRWQQYTSTDNKNSSSFWSENKYFIPGDVSVNGPFDAEGNIRPEFDPRKVGKPLPWPIRKYVKFSNSDNSEIWVCIEDEITTPATIIAGLGERAVQTDLDYLMNTNDVEKFLYKIEYTIINKLVKSGVKGLEKLLPKIIRP